MSDRVDIEQIGDVVLAELYKRLGDPTKAKEIPGTMLLRLAEHYLRYRERQEAQDDDPVVPLTFLEAIEQDLLPVEYQREKLTIYKDWLDNQLAEVKKRMKKLPKETNEPAQV